MADNQTIAKGNVTISANADPMVKGLDKAKAKADGFGKAVDSRLGAIGAGFGAGLIGGGLAEVIKKATESFIGTVNQSKEFEMALEKSAFLSNEIGKSWDRVMNNIAGAADLLAPGDSAGRIAATDESIKRLERELSGFNKAAEVSRQRLEEINSSLSKESWQLWLGGGLAQEMERIKKDLEDTLNKISKTNEQLAKLREQSRNLKDPNQDPANIKARAKAFEDLNRQIERVGMSEAELKMDDFFKTAPTADEIIKYDDKLRELEKRRMQDEAEKVFKPQRLGILETALQAFDIVKDQVANIEPATSGPMFAEALEKGSAQAYSMDVANRYGFDTTDAAQTQRDILAEQKATLKAIERTNQGIDRLNESFEATV